ncbi:hypothetical protein [Evansella tamaricis]|uniref:NADH dehydrogenase subunit 6 n=1 Tax=Evansella tamaricis TaxID=2069301 RepID=A0ABS6JHH7_9BACI|nr:hypothetical protein [Evansella tamaricis]MBU9713051.1 hypothetical protein [Evansella tamaricis]
MEYQFPEIIFLRPIFIAFIIILVANMTITIFQKKPLVTLFSVVSISIIAATISGLSLISLGYMADEYNLGGDSTSSILFLVILGLSVLNVLIYTFITGIKKKPIY